MRIISPFHDYYDSAQAQGQDRSRVFVRKTEEILVSPKTTVPAHLAPLWKLLIGGVGVSDRTHNYYLHPFLVAFAGKLYPGVDAYAYTFTNGLPVITHDYVYDFATFKTLSEARGFKLTKRSYFDRKTTEQRYEDFFSLHGSTALAAHLAEHRLTAVLVVDDETPRVVVNPPLKTVEFFKVFDAWQAYQELDMYVGNLAAPENQSLAVIGDQDRLVQHGFDKWSFRKPPQPACK